MSKSSPTEFENSLKNAGLPVIPSVHKHQKSLTQNYNFSELTFVVKHVNVIFFSRFLCSYHLTCPDNQVEEY